MNQSATQLLRKGLIALLVILFIAPALFAQKADMGIVSGTVVDATSGKPLSFGNCILLGTSYDS